MTRDRKKTAGHILALLTITVWGTTFVATKTLLNHYDALQIMLMRFFIAWVVLFLFTRKLEKPGGVKEELGIFVLSLSGITLYYYFENTALSYTLAANVSIILAAAPVFTAILAHLFTRDEKLSGRTWAGFFIAMTGVVLVVFNGAFVLKLNPLGDALSLLAALSWAVYSVVLKRYVGHYDNWILTRKMLFYALLLTAPATLWGKGLPPLNPLFRGDVLFCILFLGVLGSAVCYITWNMAIRQIGVVNTNNYIYLNPFVTMVCAAMVLKEPITAAGIVGAVLIVGGILVSELPKGFSLLKGFYPKEYLGSTYEIDFEGLYQAGWRGILFDVDNTLVPHDAPADARSIALFERLHQIGFSTCLISNNKEPRVMPFAKALHTPYVYKAGKPKPRGYQEGMRRMGTEKSNTLFVGDQLFTDVWGANLAGIHSILVKPMNPKEEIQIVLKRYLEKPVIHCYQRRQKRVNPFPGIETGEAGMNKERFTKK
ncbi:MAG: YqeG family HAD IIIA-type phosphatase [Lachnospiraceae bacterium]|jgi:HAD superfamily phosphatase (TIGR01668 family)|nr:YqeG family HAD IIIA-type phosphatase [Lachnospiraceae bacterium]